MHMKGSRTMLTPTEARLINGLIFIYQQGHLVSPKRLLTKLPDRTNVGLVDLIDQLSLHYNVDASTIAELLEEINLY